MDNLSTQVQSTLNELLMCVARGCSERLPDASSLAGVQTQDAEVDTTDDDADEVTPQLPQVRLLLFRDFSRTFAHWIPIALIFGFRAHILIGGPTFIFYGCMFITV